MVDGAQFYERLLIELAAGLAVDRGERDMSRLWDKGKPLDEQVLAYTAGEDALLDNRLVAHDVRASIAHAAMLRDAGATRGGRFRGDRSGARPRSPRSTPQGSGRSSSPTRTSTPRSSAG